MHTEYERLGSNSLPSPNWTVSYAGNGCDGWFCYAARVCHVKVPDLLLNLKHYYDPLMGWPTTPLEVDDVSHEVGFRLGRDICCILANVHGALESILLRRY